MKKFLKTVCLILALTVFAGAICACKNVKPDNGKTPSENNNSDEVKLGLHAEADGTITLNGEPFYAYGTNWHGAFWRLLSNDLDLDYSKEFEALSEAFPLFRTMAGVFYEKDQWMSVYDQEATFAAMDRLVAYCEKYHVGLIMSLMWNYWCFYDFAGEDASKCLGDPNAEGTKITLDYVKEMVSRYKDSPAVFGWEVGNEGTLHADIRPDAPTSQQFKDYYALIGEKIREIDPYRLIDTGDGCPRPYSYSLRNGDGWSYTDTEDMVKDTYTYVGVAPLNCISLHPYGNPDADRIVSLVKYAKDMNLAVMATEFGADGTDYSETKSGESYEKEKTAWNYMTDKLLESGVQIALQWDFARVAELNDTYSIELGFVKGIYQNEYQYDRIKEINQKFISEGKNKAADYWSSTEPAFYGKMGLELDGRVNNRSTAENDILKDVSVLSTGSWSGNHKTHEGNVNMSRTNCIAELQDGTNGVVTRFATVGGTGSTSFANKLMLGTLKELKKSSTYTIKITAKLTYGEGRTALPDGKQFVISANKNDTEIEMIPDNEWHTYTYTFDTDASVKCTISVAPASAKSYVESGTTMLISAVELYEGTIE